MRIISAARFSSLATGGPLRLIRRTYKVFKSSGLVGLTRAVKLALGNSISERQGHSEFKPLSTFLWFPNQLLRTLPIEPSLSRASYWSRALEGVYCQYGDNVSAYFKACVKLVAQYEYETIILHSVDRKSSKSPFLVESKMEKTVRSLLIQRASLPQDQAALLRDISDSMQLLQINDRNLSNQELLRLEFHLVSSMRCRQLTVLADKSGYVEFNRFKALLQTERLVAVSLSNDG